MSRLKAPERPKQRGGRQSRCLWLSAPAGETAGTGRNGPITNTLIPFFCPRCPQTEKAGPRGRPARDGETGGANPAQAVSVEGRHLNFGGLAVYRMAGIFDWTIERLPGLAYGLFVGSDGTLGSHSKSMGLDTHVCCEFPLSVGGAVIADGSIEILVADIVCCLGCSVARVGDGFALELSGSVRRADKGADDTLEVDLHGSFAKAFAKSFCRLADEVLVEIADPVAVDHRGAKALGNLECLGAVRACQPDHFEGSAFPELEDAAGLARVACGFCHILSFRFRSGSGPVPACPSVRSTRTGGRRTLPGPGQAKTSGTDLRVSRAYALAPPAGLFCEG